MMKKALKITGRILLILLILLLLFVLVTFIIHRVKTKQETEMLKEKGYVAMTRAIDNFIWFINLDAKGKNWGEMLKEMHEEM